MTEMRRPSPAAFLMIYGAVCGALATLILVFHWPTLLAFPLAAGSLAAAFWYPRWTQHAVMGLYAVLLTVAVLSLQLNLALVVGVFALSLLLQVLLTEAVHRLVDGQARRRVNQLINQLASQGMPEESLKQIDWEAQLEPAWPHATNDVRLMLVLARIGQAEKIKVESEEVDHEIAHIAYNTGQLPQQLKARLTKDGELPSIENQLRHTKIVDFIVNHADIETEEVTAEQLAAEMQARQAEARAQQAAEAAAAATENQPVEETPQQVPGQAEEQVTEQA